MTTRRPPPGRPPEFETYRPAEERHPAQRPQPPRPAQGSPYQDYPSYPEQAHYPQQTGYPPQQRYPQQQPMAPRDARYGHGPSHGGYGGGGYGGGPPPRRRGGGIGSFVLYGLLGLIAMVAGAVAFAIMALPANFVRDRVVAAVKQKTGRDLVIGGATSFKLYPSVGVSLADVSLSGASGFEGGKPLVAMKALDVSVAFWPLFKREVQVSTLVLREPVFNLEVDTAGRRSWHFASLDETSQRVRLAQAETGTASDLPAVAGGSPQGSLKLGDLRLDDVRIDNGALTYSDQRTSGTTELSAINAQVTLAALTAPLLANGSLGWKGQTVSFDGTLTSLSDVIESRPAKLKLALGAPQLDATFEGSARFSDGLFAEGILSAKTASARALAAWFGSDLPPSEGFGPLSAKGLLRGNADKLSFTTAEIVLDRTTARGDINVDTTRARPYVSANLKLTELDLNTYASTGGGEAAPRAAPPREPSATPQAPGAKKAQSIEDLLQETAPPGPRVKGYTKRDGWDEEPFNLTLLGLVDANAKLSIGKFTAGSMRLGQSDLTVALKNRVMTTTLDQVRLYEGTGRGTVTVDGTAGTAAAMNANLTFDGISGQPFLKDAADLDKLAGRGRLSLALAGRGTNQRQIVETMNGKIEFAFTDGAIIGINIPGMVRNLSKGNLGGLKAQPTDKTDFSELTSTWTVTNGTAENQDLKLISPLLRVGGSGRVALPVREIDYMLRPKVVASLEGQGSGADLTGLEIPVRVHGPLDNPKYTPDLGGALKDPNKAVDTIKEIGKQFKGKKADEIVNDLLGGEKGANGESGKSKGKKLLEQFLKPQ
jgi:AsmA protein